jgi:hypothetical protein
MITLFTESDTRSLICDDKEYETIGDVFLDLHHSANCGYAMCEDCIEASKNMLEICPATACEDSISPQDADQVCVMNTTVFLLRSLGAANFQRSALIRRWDMLCKSSQRVMQRQHSTLSVLVESHVQSV